jgi:basic membrane protein A and related proteins
VAYTWGDLYTRIVKSVQDKSWKSEHVRGGIETDYVTLAPFGPAVSDDIKAKIADAEKQITSGDLKIFAGPIKDNAGNEKIKAGEAGGMELLDTTDWLIEGVIGQTK